MLLPSALPCDSSQTPPLTRLQAALFASPPASPPQLSPQIAIGNIFSTCRSLQSLLAPPSAVAQEPITPPASSHAQLPTPPLAHAPSPIKLRLRSRKADSTTSTPAGDHHGPTAMKRIVKRTAAVAQQQQPPRGPNKRRRAVEDDMGRYNQNEDDSDMEQHEPLPDSVLDPGRQPDNTNQETEFGGPTLHTPKRSRIAPEVLPLGLDRSDYHSLHSSFSSSSSTDAPEDPRGTDVVVEADGEAWSTEEDRVLVELVLEKLRLTKSDWQDCARSLGKDRGSVGRRWKSLMVNGDVGLKRGSHRRGRIHGTWR
ncbi:hypothetical protein N658DRAFT_558831 [Parathielavia hyrcaniae]|uniref:Myb-like domain-containing protein n=1 Tax=Parathielavia hyrcaniae TaxID=113614 RepID=A0AAN6Q6N0_9PEZI|nr:hypothetical protein N658DRAFT_558831 [Parathielavia hyrcaniae]